MHYFDRNLSTYNLTSKAFLKRFRLHNFQNINQLSPSHRFVLRPFALASQASQLASKQVLQMNFRQCIGSITVSLKLHIENEFSCSISLLSDQH